ncbi:hypothetical protein GXW82_44125 [Streptacidiphilus sp. 4-A2]|nr:hypothetical protein [Streptacidiphilus sp. 4-A2]
MIIGVGTSDKKLISRSDIGYWQKVPDSQLPGNAEFVSVSALPDGMVLGTAADGALYSRATLTSPWRRVPGSGLVTSVTMLVDGTLVGVGLGNDLWTRNTLTADWKPLHGGAGLVKAIDAGQSPYTNSYQATLFGISLNNTLCYRTALTDSWSYVQNSDGVIDVAVGPTGSTIGVLTDNSLGVFIWDFRGWTKLPRSVPVKAVSSRRDGTLVGVGTDNFLYTYMSEFDPGGDEWPPLGWSPVAGAGDPIVAVTAMPDESLVGVRADNKLCTRTKLTDDWKPVTGGTGLVKSVTVLPDGTLVGVGLGNDLWTRTRLTDDWKRVTGGTGLVKSVTVLPDGTLVGVGLGNDLWTRTRLTDDWKPVSNSGGVVGVSALPDGSLAGVRTDNTLCTRTTLSADWQQVPNSDGVSAVAYYPAHRTHSPDPSAGKWLLQFTSRDPNASDGDGRPWGDGTAMAARATPGQPGWPLPWDNGCLVTPLIGGFATMNAVRDVLEETITYGNEQADHGVPPGARDTHVYIADWLLNGLRDLSETNSWGGQPWNAAATPTKDQTALGLLVRLMAAGITVRVLLWMPTTAQRVTMPNHADEHCSIAAAVQDYNNTLQQRWNLTQPIGVVALDLRTASPTAAALHQKMIVVRAGDTNVAFCGGVDLAFTRRDFGRPANLETGIGDWQSGDTMPLSEDGWPKQNPPPLGGYPSFPLRSSINDGPFPEDLPANVYGQGNRYWHDHHLKLEGPIVTSLEQQFSERWIIDTQGRVYLFDRNSLIGADNQVQLTSAQSFSDVSGEKRVVPLPAAQPTKPAGTAAVQMWRTIPVRPASFGRSVGPPLARGEFTVMAGVANAVVQARELITIWDQYFWSVPLAKLLAERLNTVNGLRLLIVLPPYGTSNPGDELKLRMNAMQTLWHGLSTTARDRVLALNLWKPGPDGPPVASACTCTPRSRPTTRRCSCAAREHEPPLRWSAMPNSTAR